MRSLLGGATGILELLRVGHWLASKLDASGIDAWRREAALLRQVDKVTAERDQWARRVLASETKLEEAERERDAQWEARRGIMRVLDEARQDRDAARAWALRWKAAARKLFYDRWLAENALANDRSKKELLRAVGENRDLAYYAMVDARFATALGEQAWRDGEEARALLLEAHHAMFSLRSWACCEGRTCVDCTPEDGEHELDCGVLESATRAGEVLARIRKAVGE